MPSDITGHTVLDRSDPEAPLGAMRVLRGPVFTHLLLADEINRAPAKTQSSLLEAMQVRQVTLDGPTHALDQPFMVLATQNPLDTEGTYPLREAQLDRFLLKIEMGDPPIDEQAAIEVGGVEDGGIGSDRLDDLRASADLDLIRHVAAAVTQSQLLRIGGLGVRQAA